MKKPTPKKKKITERKKKASKANLKKAWAKGRGPSGHTKARLIEMEELRKLVKPHSKKIVNALTSVSLGQQFVYKLVDIKNEDGKTIKREKMQLEDPKEIEEALNLIDMGGISEDGETFYYITTKEPDVRAAKELWDRAYGKAKETVDVNVDDKTGILSSLYQKAMEKRKNDKD